MSKRKYRYFSTIEKEEAWLNKQLKKGYQLVGPVGYGQYKFEKEHCDQDVIRIDVRKFKGKANRLDYLQFMEDAGWKPIKSTDKDSKFYFIGNKEESDELFSDNESKYEREVRAKKRLTITNSWIAIYYILFFFTGQNRSVFFNVKNAFLTPGIWDKHGDSFRRAFLFELPFAIVRMFLAYAPLILLIYFVYQSYLVNQSIKRYKEDLI